MQTMRQNEPILEIEASYIWPYILKVPEGEIQEILATHFECVSSHFANFPEAKADFAYAPGKWMVRQLMGHMVDAQNVFTYRAFSIARGESQELLPFDEGLYSHFWLGHSATLSEMTRLYRASSQATLAQASMLSSQDLSRQGIANRLRLTPRHLFRAIIGHESHHLTVLLERYGLSL